jgi:peptidoglycan/LPS O-acetylase OafA/YrhL
VRAGGAGVDLFFALSAYLITSLLIKERAETGGISVRLFYIRRVLRIWPLYFLVVLAGVVLSYSMSHNFPWFYEQRLPWYYVAGYLGFISNWIYAIFGAAPLSICAPLWTVAIEEQFYLIWPALMKGLRRRGMMIAAVVTFLLAILSQTAVVAIGADRLYISFGSASRCESLTLGILLALFAGQVPRAAGFWRLMPVVAGVATWVVSCWWFADLPGPATMRMVVGRLLISLGAGAMLYGCLGSKSRILTGRWVVQLGKLSYGLYMLHFLGLLLMATLLHPVGRGQLFLSRVFGFAATVGLAFLSYRWVETPFLRRKDRFARVLSRPV